MKAIVVVAFLLVALASVSDARLAKLQKALAKTETHAEAYAALEAKIGKAQAKVVQRIHDDMKAMWTFSGVFNDIVSGLGLDSATDFSEDIYNAFRDFASNFHRTYSDSSAYMSHIRNFWDSYSFVNSMREVTSSAVYAINKFSDWSYVTWIRFANGAKEFVGGQPSRTLNEYKATNPEFRPALSESCPMDLDWSTRDKVTPVRNQQQCGSCWAFASVGVLESYLLIHSGAALAGLDLSEQELVDCYKTGDNGCQGGWMQEVAKYIHENGLSRETSYGYRATYAACNAGSRRPALSQLAENFYVKENRGGWDGMKEMLCQYGPVSVSMGGDVLWGYTSGIIDEAGATRASQLKAEYVRTHPEAAMHSRHAVVIVGFHDDANHANRHWIVENSWGADWGEHGYFRIRPGVADIDDDCVGFPAVTIS